MLSYITKKPPWGPVGEITYKRTYAREGEDWYQTCARVVNGCYTLQEKHCKEAGRPWDASQAQHSARQMYDLIYNMKFLPPGRGLRNMGTSIVSKTGASLNNCGFVSTEDDPFDSFCWAMDMLMLGVGVGFDTLGAGFKISPPRTGASRVHVVADSREGWTSALRDLLHQYSSNKTGYSLDFDYSQVRPRGSPITGFGGVASGPTPLIEMLNSVRELLYKRACGLGYLTSADINDIMALVGRCVVSGGVRRSAEIAFGESTDSAFMQLKNRLKFPVQCDQYRWAANHSIKCNKGDDYGRILANTDGVAELGIFWLDNARFYGRMGRRANNDDMRAAGCNPCAEQTLEHKELCCLVEVFPSRINSFYEFQKVLKYAYLYAKTVTTAEIHDPVTQEIVKRNRRIGCSLTGIQQSITKLGNSVFYSWCSRGYKYLKQLDERYSEWLHVPRSIKITSVKPSGTVSKLPGVSSGIHFPVSEYYFQVIRFASNSPYISALQQSGYRCVDLAPNEPNTTAVYFPVREEDYQRSEKDVSIWEQAEHAAKLQHYWADNQVSITVKYKPEERSQLANLLRMYEDRLKAISFFPSEDHGFDHAPWQPIDSEQYLAYKDNLKPITYTKSVHDADDEFCSGGICELSQKRD